MKTGPMAQLYVPSILSRQGVRKEKKHAVEKEKDGMKEEEAKTNTEEKKDEMMTNARKDRVRCEDRGAAAES